MKKYIQFVFVFLSVFFLACSTQYPQGSLAGKATGGQEQQILKNLLSGKINVLSCSKDDLGRIDVQGTLKFTTQSKNSFVLKDSCFDTTNVLELNCDSSKLQAWARVLSCDGACVNGACKSVPKPAEKTPETPLQPQTPAVSSGTDLSVDYYYITNANGFVQTSGFLYQDKVKLCMVVRNYGTQSANGQVVPSISVSTYGAQLSTEDQKRLSTLKGGEGADVCTKDSVSLLPGEQKVSININGAALYADANSANDKVEGKIIVSQAGAQLNLKLHDLPFSDPDFKLAPITEGYVNWYKVQKQADGSFTVVHPYDKQTVVPSVVQMTVEATDMIIFEGYKQKENADYVLKKTNVFPAGTVYYTTMLGKVCSSLTTSAKLDCLDAAKTGAGYDLHLGYRDLPDFSVGPITLYTLQGDAISGTTVVATKSIPATTKGSLCVQVENKGIIDSNAKLMGTFTLNGQIVQDQPEDKNKVVSTPQYTLSLAPKIKGTNALSMGSNPSVDTSLSTEYNPTLVAGKVTEVCYGVQFPKQENLLTYTFKLDPQNVIKESSELNNDGTIAFEIISAPATPSVAGLLVTVKNAIQVPGTQASGSELPFAYVNKYILSKENGQWRGISLNSNMAIEAKKNLVDDSNNKLSATVAQVTLNANPFEFFFIEGFTSKPSALARVNPFIPAGETVYTNYQNKLCLAKLDENGNYKVDTTTCGNNKAIIGYKDAPDLKIVGWKLDFVANAPFKTDTLTHELCFDVKNIGIAQATITPDSINVKDQLYIPDGQGGYKQGTALKDSIIAKPLIDGTVKSNEGITTVCYTYTESYLAKNSYTFKVTAGGVKEVDETNNEIIIPTQS